MYHDIEFIKITMYQPMLRQTNYKTKNFVKNIIRILQFSYLNTVKIQHLRQYLHKGERTLD